jgi:hypothetical protein
MTEGLARWAEKRNARLSDHAAGIPVTEMLGGHLSLSRKAFDALGRFDAAFTEGGRFGGEDLDFGWRASSLGIPVVYEPRAIAKQVWDKSFRALCRDIREAGGSDVRLARKHPELVPSLTLGNTEGLPPWERRAAEFTLASPRLASALFSPALVALDLAARARARGRRLEHLHAVCRAHLYARGMIDAGYDRSVNEPD